MISLALHRSTMTLVGPVLGLVIAAVPAYAARPAQGTLVHCGEETCLRIAGHRADLRDAIRIEGQDLAVEGGRAWHVTVPLAQARAWSSRSGNALTLAQADAVTGIERTNTVSLPPGALGRRVELASLVVRAR